MISPSELETYPASQGEHTASSLLMLPVIYSKLSNPKFQTMEIELNPQKTPLQNSVHIGSMKYLTNYAPAGPKAPFGHCKPIHAELPAAYTM
jgi:hypothetical protein